MPLVPGGDITLPSLSSATMVVVAGDGGYLLCSLAISMPAPVHHPPAPAALNSTLNAL